MRKVAGPDEGNASVAFVVFEPSRLWVEYAPVCGIVVDADVQPSVVLVNQLLGTLKGSEVGNRVNAKIEIEVMPVGAVSGEFLAIKNGR